MKRSRLRPAEKRVLLGYGPGVLLAIGFLLMAALVPTVAPEQVVSSGGGGSGGASGVLASGPLDGSSGTASSTGLASGSPAAGSGAGSPSAAASVASGLPASQSAGAGSPGASTAGGTRPGATASNGSRGPAKSSGSAAATAGSAATCAGRQVPQDPYSPPCISFKGSNGGSTSRGVTASTIKVSYRVPADNIASIDQAIQQIAGKYVSSQFTDTPADIERTLGDLVTYFNQHFQFYGRKMVLQSFKGQGQLTQEITNAGQAQAQADALSAADSVGSFADISALSQPYAGALTAQKVINIGAPYMSQEWFSANAPYSWSFFPNCSDLAAEGAAVGVHEIVGLPVSWGGEGVANGQGRRVAVLAPDNPIYQQCTRLVTSALAKAGHPPVANLSYTLDLSQLAPQAGSLEQQIVNDHITTVLCGCDPITLLFLTGDLENAHYEPEWANIGAAFTDEDLVAQLFQPKVWSHAAGVTNNGTQPPYGSSLAYFAAKSVDPGHPPAKEVDLLYEDLYLLALGIQMAGPNLNPATFQQGMWNYQGGTGQYGPWTFKPDGTGSWTTQHRFRFEWWNPNVTSPSDGQKGTWVVGPNWFTPADVPPGKPPVFPNGPQ